MVIMVTTTARDSGVSESIINTYVHWTHPLIEVYSDYYCWVVARAGLEIVIMSHLTGDHEKQFWFHFCIAPGTWHPVLTWIITVKTSQSSFKICCHWWKYHKNLICWKLHATQIIGFTKYCQFLKLLVFINLCIMGWSDPMIWSRLITIVTMEANLSLITWWWRELPLLSWYFTW